MALQGSFSGTTGNSRIKPTISWSAVQSVTENYSDITATLTYRRNNSYVTAGSWSGSLTVGEQTFTGSKSISITDDADAVAISATARVYHDDYGALTVTISATGAVAGSTLTSTTISGAVTPDTIARASTVSCPDADIGSRTTVVVARKNSAFTHSIAYAFGELTGYMDADGNAVEQEVPMDAVAVNFLVPESFYEQLSDAASGVCTLTCRTYSAGEQVGQPQVGEFTVTAPREQCCPVVSGTVVDDNPDTLALTGNEAVLVRYLSTAICRIRARARHGATIVSRQIDGVTVTTDALKKPYAFADTVTFSATDSRGYTTTCRVPVTLLRYVVLTNDAVARRLSEGSDQVQVTLRGDCWQGSFGRVENTLSATVRTPDGTVLPVTLTVEDGRYSGSLVLEGLAYDKSWELTVTVSDQLLEQPLTLTVNKGTPVFDWGETDFRFNVPVAVPSLTVGGMTLEEYIRAVITS